MEILNIQRLKIMILFLDCYYTLDNTNYIYNSKAQPEYFPVCTETNVSVVDEQNTPISAEIISDKKRL